jgi:hypothetical protein
MPNFVTTRCTVHGSAADINAFWDKVVVNGDDDRLQFDFDKIIPIPADVPSLEQDGERSKDLSGLARPDGTAGYLSWDDWRMQNWGTKWNSNALTVFDDEPLQFMFDTALGFPLQIFEALARQHPTLRFECAMLEESGWFAGKGFFNAGNGEPAFKRCLATTRLRQMVLG